MISAIILAAGQSTRMGQPKMLLPWRNNTVIEYVISVFGKAEIEDILVITGGVHKQVDEIIWECRNRYPVRSIYNEDYLEGEMLSSIQCGLRDLKERNREAAMIGLGDQPQVEEGSVRLVHDAFLQTKHPIVVPSFQMRRGHPWLVAQSMWNEILTMRSPQTLRDFLNIHRNDIHYVNAETATILADMDTPEDYATAHSSLNHL